MKCALVFLILLLPVIALAELPLDVVFDIDLTIVARVEDGPHGDLLADPQNPRRGTVEIQFHEPHYDRQNRPRDIAPTLKAERYRVFEGMTDLMQKLKALQEDGKVRVSFFSGGSEPRNETLLKTIKLPDGTSLWDLSQGRVHGRSALTPTGLPSNMRIRDRFKKDLTRINPDLSDVIIIDDIKEFVPVKQRDNLLWIGEEFPYPERVKHPPESVDPVLLERERNKFQWISREVESAITKRLETGRPLSRLIQEVIPPVKPASCNLFTIMARLMAQ